MSVVFTIASILGISGNIADGIALYDFYTRLRRIDFFALYVDAFVEAIRDITSNSTEITNRQLQINKNNFERELRQQAFFSKLLSVSLTVDNLNKELRTPLARMLSSVDIIAGGDIDDQIIQLIIETSHIKFQKKVLENFPAFALQSQINEISQGQDQLMNLISNLYLLISKWNEEPSIPIPSGSVGMNDAIFG